MSTFDKTIVEDIKTLFNNDIDKKLEVIERRTKARLCMILGTEIVPDELDHISYEVTLKRFNRIGQEGMTSYNQEGLSMAFPESDFAEYMEEIAKYKDKDKGLLGPKHGSVKFL
ncbi:phage head-tail connector protein [Melissococcus plutonius]|uniref:phage head-tail connector protein n=1 Tax=Melissococcus plutonius TaxID=33970 RepID=UPI0021E5CE42|nr:phage head-tail connector protein [Melissococcus plutonius]MCV2499572.1 phage head-tail connector protein [Melissococcus plutonius]MCV2501862.1 phage head-tail connector protein [Melissococcus plutonius]MCV2505942.1 phage head-tail connector protein [Melissococcus plutonius]MCV2508184.1 phage head-tail connector protein [Melissococcus plutonius]MCV2528040.1 phage head-tail connector protein [Melissococcus plutonius]